MVIQLAKPLEKPVYTNNNKYSGNYYTAQCRTDVAWGLKNGMTFIRFYQIGDKFDH